MFIRGEGLSFQDRSTLLTFAARLPVELDPELVLARWLRLELHARGPVYWRGLNNCRCYDPIFLIELQYNVQYLKHTSKSCC